VSQWAARSSGRPAFACTFLLLAAALGFSSRQGVAFPPPLDVFGPVFFFPALRSVFLPDSRTPPRQSPPTWPARFSQAHAPLSLGSTDSPQESLAPQINFFAGLPPEQFSLQGKAGWTEILHRPAPVSCRSQFSST